MKAFITHLKSWFILLLTGSLMFMFVFACSTPPEGQSTTTTTTTGGSGDGDDDDDDDDKDLACALPKCSGSKCCNKTKDEDKQEECEEWCGDSDYLDLSGEAEDKCLTLDYEFVKSDLTFLFGNDVLSDPDEEKLLDDIKPDDVNKICAAVRELDPDIWGDIINDYSQSEAAVVLGWIAQEKKAVKIFEKTKEKKDGIDMFKTLLRKLTDDLPGDIGVIQGLGESIDFDDDDDDESPNILARALRENNADLVRFIHQEIVKDPEEGICGKDNSSNWPDPHEGTQELCGHSGNRLQNAKRHQQRACMLAVYCKAFSVAPATNTENANDREDFGEEINDMESSIKSFIRNDIEKGGLGLRGINEDAKWTQRTCESLSYWWNNPSNELNLNLGTQAGGNGCS